MNFPESNKFSINLYSQRTFLALLIISQAEFKQSLRNFTKCDFHCYTHERVAVGRKNPYYILHKHFYRLAQHRMYSILLCESNMWTDPGRRFQPGEGPRRGLLLDSLIFANLCLKLYWSLYLPTCDIINNVWLRWELSIYIYSISFYCILRWILGENLLNTRERLSAS